MTQVKGASRSKAMFCALGQSQIDSDPIDFSIKLPCALYTVTFIVSLGFKKLKNIGIYRYGKSQPQN